MAGLATVEQKAALSTACQYLTVHTWRTLENKSTSVHGPFSEAAMMVISELEFRRYLDDHDVNTVVHAEETTTTSTIEKGRHYKQ